MSFDIKPTARESLDSKYSMCDAKVNLLSIISPRYLASLTTSIGVELMATVMLLGARLSSGGTRSIFSGAYEKFLALICLENLVKLLTSCFVATQSTYDSKSCSNEVRFFQLICYYQGIQQDYHKRWVNNPYVNL